MGIAVDSWFYRRYCVDKTGGNDRCPKKRLPCRIDHRYCARCYLLNLSIKRQAIAGDREKGLEGWELRGHRSGIREPKEQGAGSRKQGRELGAKGNFKVVLTLWSLI